MTTETNLATKPNQDVQELGERPAISPLVDIFENEDEYLILADLPGVTKDALDIRIDKDELTIQGRREAVTQGSLLAGSAQVPDFRRVFRVPDTLDTGKVHAELNAGVLRLRLPKSEAIRPRKIAITSG